MEYIINLTFPKLQSFSIMHVLQVILDCYKSADRNWPVLNCLTCLTLRTCKCSGSRLPPANACCGFHELGTTLQVLDGILCPDYGKKKKNSALKHYIFRINDTLHTPVKNFF